jgi:hypothetical protein
MAQQVFGVGAVGRVEADSDGGGHLHFVGAEAQVLRSDARIFSATSPAASAEARSRSTTTNSSPPWRETVSPSRRHSVMRLRRLAQQPVADVVPERVVHVLEAVQVEEEHRHAQAVAVRVGDGLLEAVLQQRAIGQARERVVLREVRDALLGGVALGDVEDGGAAHQHSPVGAAHHAGRQQHREARAVAADHLVLDVAQLPLLDELGEVGAVRLARIGVRNSWNFRRPITSSRE